MVAARSSLGALQGPWNCKWCRQDGEIGERSRRSWGCDTPTTMPQVSFPCVCGSSCSVCDGKLIEVFSCPNAVRLMSLPLIGYARDGSWPVDGGLLAQSASFVRAVQIVSAVVSQVEEERSSAAKRAQLNRVPRPS